jgi:hypothetical protein
LPGGRASGVGGCDAGFFGAFVSAWAFVLLDFDGDTGLELLLDFDGDAGLELLLEFEHADAGLTNAGGRALGARGLIGFVLGSFGGEAGVTGVTCSLEASGLSCSLRYCGTASVPYLPRAFMSMSVSGCEVLATEERLGCAAVEEHGRRTFEGLDGVAVLRSASFAADGKEE